MSLQGADALIRRLNALENVGRSISEDVAQEAASLMRSRVRHRTGVTAASIRVDRVTDEGAGIVADGGARFLEHGTRAHVIVPRNARRLRFQERGATVFAKRVNHPHTQAHPFVQSSLRDATEHEKLADHVIDAWNGAA